MTAGFSKIGCCDLKKEYNQSTSQKMYNILYLMNIYSVINFNIITSKICILITTVMA